MNFKNKKAVDFFFNTRNYRALMKIDNYKEVNLEILFHIKLKLRIIDQCLQHLYSCRTSRQI